VRVCVCVCVCGLSRCVALIGCHTATRVIYVLTTASTRHTWPFSTPASVSQVRLSQRCPSLSTP